MPNPLSAEEGAYLAGLVDGDGYVGILRRRTRRTLSGYTYYSDLEISSVNERFLQQIHALVGAGCWTQRNRGFRSKRTMYHLKVGPNTLRWLLPLLIPHLKLKKRQAEIVLAHLHTIKKGRHGQSPQSEDRYWELRRMNRRGTLP